MRKTLLFLVISIFWGLQVIGQNSLTGYVKYDNTQQTPMQSGTTVHLKQASPAVDLWVMTDITGHYEFLNIPDGAYTISATSTLPWGGGNAADALLISKHFVGLSLLTGLRLKVADVNGSGGIPGTVDGLTICRRFVGQISSFLPPNVPIPGGPDWYSDTYNLVFSNNSVLNQDLKVLCAGDVNGSYIPF